MSLFGSSGGSSNAEAPDTIGSASQAPDTIGGGSTEAPSTIGGGSSAPDTIGGDSTEAPDRIGDAPDVIGSPSSSAAEAPDLIGDGSTRIPDSIGDDSTQAPDAIGEPSPSASQAPNTIGESSPSATNAPDSIGSESPAAQAPEVIGGKGEAVTQGISEHSKITMPDGYKAEVSGDTMSVTTPGGKTIDGLHVNKDGSLTAAAQNTLRENGLKISDHVTILHDETTADQTVSSREFVANHRDEMTTIGQREWVKGPQELGLHNHLNQDGSITIEMTGMPAGDLQNAAAEGQLNAYLSTSPGSSAQGFKIPLGPDGKATIGADSPIRALFSEDGHFQAGYEEASITKGTVEGADNIAVLATAVGENKGSFTDAVTSQTPVAEHAYTITESTTDINANSSAFVESVGTAAEFGVPIITMPAPRTQLGQTGRVTPVATPDTPGRITASYATTSGSSASG
ncbi:MAG: hypothetical protein AAB834_01150, partial [Patescibacteria group bacterium]